MNELGSFFGSLDPVAILCGGVLVAWGRRLFWLALGIAGFVLGMALASHLTIDADDTLRLAFGAILGFLGALLAIAAQRLAIVVAGIVIGGLGLLWLAQPWAADLGPWIWALALVGAIAGVGLAKMVFELALVVLTSALGAGLLVEALDPADRIRPWLLLVFAVAGLVLQSRGRRKRD